MRTLSRRLLGAASCLCVVMLLVAGGCGEPPITGDTVRSDMSPELFTLTRTREQHRNDVARSLDETTSQMADDWDAIWFIDRPLRMSKFTIP